jgi:stage II sporulation protein M
LFFAGHSVKEVIHRNRSWLFMAAALFIASGVFFYYRFPGTGGLADLLAGEAGLQMDQLQKLVNFIVNLPAPAAVAFIFINNFLSTVQMLLLGAGLGIMPLITLALNGALVGATAAAAVSEGTNLFKLICFGILPHGIFELGAFFLAGALGLKFGYHCVASPLPGLNRFQSFKYIWKEAISILPLVVSLLALAALVEMTITPLLITRFL